jgi:uncharacterized membrane protein YbhN (UPF0104 family)
MTAAAAPFVGRRSSRRFVTYGLPAVAALAVAAVLIDRRDAFAAALHGAPVWLLGCAVALQLLALLARSEAWRMCVGAAGSTVTRRRTFRASALGGMVGIVNGQAGLAARIAALRRSPGECPKAGALVAAEFPIIAVEAGLAALTSFTLLGPLGLPWWVAVICVSVVASLVAGAVALSRSRTTGICSGLAILRTVDGPSRVVALVVTAVLAQIARNWLALHAIGLHASVFDAIAVLIVLVTLSQLPIGPSVGAAAAVVILGTHGVTLAAAAGVLLTATGIAGTLCFGGWALADRMLPAPVPAAAVP